MDSGEEQISSSVAVLPMPVLSLQLPGTGTHGLRLITIVSLVPWLPVIL